MALKGLVKPERRQPRVVLYGPPGVGKSSFGAESDAPVFVPTENGIDNLPVAQFLKATNWAALLENVREVSSGDHKHKTLIIDTLNGAAQLCAEHVCQTQFGGVWVSKKGQEGFNSYGSGWSSTAEKMRELIVILDECREKRGMMVLMLAHTGIQSVKNPSGSDYTKYQPDVPKQVWAMIHAWSDIIARADYEFSVLPPKSGLGKGKATGTNVRVLYTTGDASQDAKTRVGYELPEKMGLSFSEFAESLGKQDSAIDEIAALWPVLDKAGAVKALAYLGIGSIDQIAKADGTKARQTLNRLRQLSAEQAAQNATTEQEKAQ